MEISLSILTINYNRIEEDLKPLASNLKYLHLDVMDGHFVPNLSFGPALIKSLRKESNLFFDTHLMISDPEKYIPQFIQAGSDCITFHLEAVKDPLALIEFIHSQNVKAGISIKPATKVEKLLPYLPYVDLVLIMSVEPGFGGQSFMESSIDKLKYLKQQKLEKGYTYWISVDGGINDETLPKVAPYRDLAVSGSFVLNALNPLENLKKLKHI